MEKYNSGLSDIFKLEVDGDAKNNFLEMARWTKFLAILGFVVLSLALVAGILLSVFINVFAQAYGSTSPLANMGAAGPIIIMSLFIAVIGIYIYPTYALLKYSSCIKSAILTENKEQFNKAIKYLKGMFKYIGILMVICLAIYGLEVVIAIISVIGR